MRVFLIELHFQILPTATTEAPALVIYFDPYPFFCFQFQPLTSVARKDTYQASTRPPWLHHSCFNCLQSLVHVKMEPALLNTASPHPPPPAAKDQSQWQVAEVRSSIGSYSLKWRITWMMPLLQILWPSSEDFQKTHLASPHSCLTVNYLINVLKFHALSVDMGCRISLRTVSLDSLQNHESSPSLFSKDHMYKFSVAIYILCTVPCWQSASDARPVMIFKTPENWSSAFSSIVPPWLW